MKYLLVFAAGIVVGVLGLIVICAVKVGAEADRQMNELHKEGR